MKRIIKRFLAPMVMTTLLCITSPTFAKIPNIVNDSTSAQNQSFPSLEKQARTDKSALARSHYQKGNFSQAAKLFLEASEAYKASYNPIRQALSLSNLSLCYQKLGKWEDANRVITDSIALLKSIKNTTTEKLSALAQTLDIQGGLQLAQGKTNTALQSWENVTTIYTQLDKPKLALISQTKQAQALQNLGLYRRAIPKLEKALKLPSGLFDKILKLPPNLSIEALKLPSNQLEIENKLNLPNNSITKEQITVLLKFHTLLDKIEKISPSPETVTALRILGDSLRVVGNFQPAEIILQRSLDIAKQLQLPDAIALAQLSLGNTTRIQTSSNNSNEKRNKNLVTPQEASLNFYQQAAKSTSPNIRVQAQLNQLSLLANKKIGLLENKEYQNTAKNLLSQIKQEIEALPPTHTSIQARINLAHTMMAIREQIPTATSHHEIAQTLAVAVQQAKDLGNPRTLSYALGTLGNVYEQSPKGDKTWEYAQKLTEEALQLAQQINAGDIAYIWQWQLGRVTKAQGKTKSAIAAYKEAVGTIKSLRADLAAANPDLQFSFKDAIEPIHREFVTLLLESESKKQSNQKSNKQDNLKTARDVIEGLQLVELDNFFRQACLNANLEQIDKVDNNAAVIYPIILEKQLAIIASLPKSGANSLDENQQENQRDFRYYKTAISREEIESRVSGLGNHLRQQNAFELAFPELKEMYNLIIRPEAEDLKTSGVKTLVFVLDGVLRNIPMSALHDGEKYLVEDYSIALTPGLQLLAPRSLQQQPLAALVGGLSESRGGYKALPHVTEEVKKVESTLPSQVLINKQFTNPAFQNKVSAVPFPIVHLATHGKFGSTAEDTFIVTWDGKVNVNDLSASLKTAELSQDNSLELLVLSACETAAGDDRSALGLAGVAVRSGAKSTVATLWKVNDESSVALMSAFYEQLVKAKETGISKAEALRRAQIKILKESKYASPYYWGAYVLLGNWI